MASIAFAVTVAALSASACSSSGSGANGVSGTTATSGSTGSGASSHASMSGASNASSRASSGASDAGSGSADASAGGDAGHTPADAGAPGDAATGDSGAPGVRIVGRTVAGTAGPRFEWSGVNIAARFTGTQASIELDDQSNRNEFTVVIDGTVQPNLVTQPGTTTYPLATVLPGGTHDVVVWRRTEASYGYTEFLGFTGFSAGGGLVAPPAAPAHKIEIVGDSISCGYGIEGTSSCTSAQLESIENNYLAYGSVAASALGADVVTVAWSGIGVYRNYNEVGPSTNTMPQRYDYAIPTTTTAWDFSQYQPDAVVINLTSNDFSTHGDPGQPYIDAFVAFVKHIRSKYPGAYLFLLIEWRSNGSDSTNDVNAVVSQIEASGDTQIESFDISAAADSSGCQGHPDVAGGHAMGTALAAEMKRVLHW
jgi:hypothetical protein